MLFPNELQKLEPNKYHWLSLIIGIERAPKYSTGFVHMIVGISLFFARPVAIDEYFYSFSIFGQARRTMIYSFGYGIGYAENKSVVMLQVSNGFCHNW